MGILNSTLNSTQPEMFPSVTGPGLANTNPVIKSTAQSLVPNQITLQQTPLDIFRINRSPTDLKTAQAAPTTSIRLLNEKGESVWIPFNNGASPEIVYERADGGYLFLFRPGLTDNGIRLGIPDEYEQYIIPLDRIEYRIMYVPNKDNNIINLNPEQEEASGSIFNVINKVATNPKTAQSSLNTSLSAYNSGLSKPGDTYELLRHTADTALTADVKGPPNYNLVPAGEGITTTPGPTSQQSIAQNSQTQNQQTQNQQTQNQQTQNQQTQTQNGRAQMQQQPQTQKQQAVVPQTQNQQQPQTQKQQMQNGRAVTPQQTQTQQMPNMQTLQTNLQQTLQSILQKYQDKIVILVLPNSEQL